MSVARLWHRRRSSVVSRPFPLSPFVQMCRCAKHIVVPLLTTRLTFVFRQVYLCLLASNVITEKVSRWIKSLLVSLCIWLSLCANGFLLGFCLSLVLALLCPSSLIHRSLPSLGHQYHHWSSIFLFFCLRCFCLPLSTPLFTKCHREVVTNKIWHETIRKLRITNAGTTSFPLLWKLGPRTSGSGMTSENFSQSKNIHKRGLCHDIWLLSLHCYQTLTKAKNLFTWRALSNQ